MKLYVVVCEDRHTDVLVKVYSTPEKAIASAKEFVEESGDPKDIEESNVEGWLYSCVYSCEGDCVRVEKVILDN